MCVFGMADVQVPFFYTLSGLKRHHLRAALSIVCVLFPSWTKCD